LHNLRPLAKPSFTFPWIMLATEKHLIGTLSDRSNWELIATIIADYCSAVTLVDQTSEIFGLLYRSLLRFILILEHDFPDFVVWAAQELALLLPPGFSQLRNILLNAAPENTVLSPPSRAIKKMMKMPGIDSYNPQAFLIPQGPYSVKMDFSGDFVKQFENNGGAGPYVVWLACNEASESTPEKINTSVKETAAYNAIVTMISKIGPGEIDIITQAITGLLDCLRYPNRVTLFAIRAVIALFQSGIEVAGSPPIGLDELVLRLLAERAVAEEPHPWGIRVVMRSLLMDKTIDIYNREFVQRSDSIAHFLKTSCAAFCGDDL